MSQSVTLIFCHLARRWLVSAAAGGVAAFLAIGCAGHAAPPAPLGALARVGAFAGTPMSGPTGVSSLAPASGQLVVVRVKWVAIAPPPPPRPAAAMPQRPGMVARPMAAPAAQPALFGVGGPGGLLPLDARADLTVSPTATHAVLTSGVLTRRAGFGQGATASDFASALSAGRWGKIAIVDQQQGPAAPETTAVFSLHPPGGSAGQTLPGITLAIHPLKAMRAGPGAQSRPAWHVSIAVGVTERLVTPVAGSLGVQPETPPAETRTETAYLNDVELAPGEPLAVVAPVEWMPEPWRAVAALVTVWPAAAGDEPALQMRLQGEVAASAGAAAPATMPGSWPTLDSAVLALAEATSRRPAMVFLADRIGAPVAGDVVLVADDAMLAELAGRVRAFAIGFRMHGGEPTSGQLRWFLEKTCLQILADQEEKNALPPELASVLAIHLGEVGRHADLIDSAIKASASEAELMQQVTAQNLISLEDNFPAARVRAFDWLKRQGDAPAGYDPLGSRHSRQEALDRAEGGS